MSKEVKYLDNMSLGTKKLFITLAMSETPGADLAKQVDMAVYPLEVLQENIHLVTMNDLVTDTEVSEMQKQLLQAQGKEVTLEAALAEAKKYN